MISFSVVFSRRFLARKLNGHLALPKGLMPVPNSAESKLMDLLRKYRDANRTPPPSLIRRIGNGDYDLAGRRVYELWESYTSNDIERFNKGFAAQVGDYTKSAEYVEALKRADGQLLRIANNEAPIDPNSERIPAFIIEGLQEYKTGKIESFLSRCYLFSLAIFDANPMLKTKIFDALFKEPENNCQKALVSILKRKIRDSRIKIKGFAKMMYPNNTDPRYSLDAYLRNPTRIIQPHFIKRFAETYYDNCFDTANKKVGMREYLVLLWNFAIQSAVCMDKMRETLDFDFQGEGEKHYAELLKYANLYYSDTEFSRNT